MIMRTVFKTASVFFLFKLFDKVLSSKVRFQSVIIEKDFLRTLLDSERFISLFFSSVYDNRTLAKDRVALVAHSKNEVSGGQMTKYSLKIIDKGNVLDNERNYSSYEIKKEELRDLLEKVGSEAQYFIFRPVNYALDPDYVSYNIIAADRYKNAFLEKHGDYAYTARMNPSPPAFRSFELSS